MKQRVVSLLRRFAIARDGTTAIEYGLAAALLSTAIVAFLSDLDDPSGLLGRIKALIDSVLA